MQRNMVWFRNDLRLFDNPALFHASASSDAVIAIYIASPAQWQKHDDAAVKQDFWRRNLVLVQQQLKQLNIDLRYFEVDFYEDIPKLIASICTQWRIDSVFFNCEYPVNEQRRDQAVKLELAPLSVRVHDYHDQLLLAPSSVRNKSGQPFKVFTPFSKQAREQLPDSFDLYPRPNQQVEVAFKPHPQQCLLEDVSWPEVSEQLQQYWPAGEEAGSHRLTKFYQSAIDDYHDTRDIPSLRGTSKLSAYLASGVISIRECWSAISRYCSPTEGVRIWQNELLWREFYKHILIDFPHVSKHLPWKRHTDSIPWRHDNNVLQAWQQGETGFPLIDAAMKQLLECGWMHNRLRMVTAMFLTKHLLIDWRLGEKWFMQHLIDGELAANNGGWQWSASTGTDSVPYFRIFNPITQSQRFDPEGIFIKQYLPQLSMLSSKDIHQPKEHQRQGYVQPIIDLKYGRQRALSAFKQLQVF